MLTGWVTYWTPHYLQDTDPLLSSIVIFIFFTLLSSYLLLLLLARLSSYPLIFISLSFFPISFSSALMIGKYPRSTLTKRNNCDMIVSFPPFELFIFLPFAALLLVLFRLQTTESTEHCFGEFSKYNQQFLPNKIHLDAYTFSQKKKKKAYT